MKPEEVKDWGSGQGTRDFRKIRELYPAHQRRLLRCRLTTNSSHVSDGWRRIYCSVVFSSSTKSGGNHSVRAFSRGSGKPSAILIHQL